MAGAETTNSDSVNPPPSSGATGQRATRTATEEHHHHTVTDNSKSQTPVAVGMSTPNEAISEVEVDLEDTDSGMGALDTS